MMLLDIFDIEHQNSSTAVFWHKKFARNDNLSAIRKVEYLYRLGLIVKENQELTKYWSDLAKKAEARPVVDNAAGQQNIFKQKTLILDSTK